MRRHARWATAVLLSAALLPAVSRAEAQTAAAAGSSATSPFGQAMRDDRAYAHALFDELEGRLGSMDLFRWDAEGWFGTNDDRLWLKSEGIARSGSVDDGDQELLYDRPVSPYFDLQGGLRYDLDSLAGRGWAALGIQGLAPGFFNVSATLYASDAGHYAAKLQASYDALLTQRLILQPLLEVNAYTRADLARDVGPGVSDLDTGLRLRYEITRKCAPYVGVTYRRISGPVSGTRQTLNTSLGTGWHATLGVRAWL